MSIDEKFEEELMAALRRTGDTFASDDGGRLVTGGVAQGRRRVARRRAGTVAGGVLAIALVSVGGVYAAGTVGGGAGGGGDRGNGGSSVAAPAVPTPTGAATSTASAPDTGDLSGEQLAAIFESLTPDGRLTDPVTRGTTDELGPLVSGVYDDGQGKAAVSMGFYRTAPGADDEKCPDKVFTPYDACTVEKLPGGATLVIFQGYEYPDKREPTKLWRAMYYKDGSSIDLSTWNAPAQKGAPVSRENPPFGPAELKRIVTAEEWKPVIAAVANLSEAPGKTSPGETAPGQDNPGKGDPGQNEPVNDDPGKGNPGKDDPGKDDLGKATSPEQGYEFDGAEVRPTFLSLLPKGLEVTVKSEDDGEYAYAVVDDGKGATLVEVNAQPDMSDVEGQLFLEGSYTTLPDGTKVATHWKRGDKPGEKWWQVDTMRSDGYRVVVSAWNKATAHGDPTRTEPAVTMEQLKAIATSEKWLALKTPKK